MCEKCLYCYGPLKPGERDYHASCARKFFGRAEAPQMPYSRDNISDLALKVIERRMSVTGVQPKLSMDIERGMRSQGDRLTIVGLWGRFILKPQSERYRHLPELEDLTMKMAAAARIAVAEHSLIRMADGELAYVTKRMDRDDKGNAFSMLDMCQLSNRLTEHKYRGSYTQLAETVRKYSSASMLDVQRFWEIVLFSWICGNSDMHCKNFSLLDRKDGRGYLLSPAYDLLAVLLTGITDADELAMTLTGPGVEDGSPIGGYDRESFLSAMQETGVAPRPAARIIDRLVACKPQWMLLIDKSFLPEDLKSAYRSLIEERLQRLSPSGAPIPTRV